MPYLGRPGAGEGGVPWRRSCQGQRRVQALECSEEDGCSCCGVGCEWFRGWRGTTVADVTCRTAVGIVARDWERGRDCKDLDVSRPASTCTRHAPNLGLSSGPPEISTSSSRCTSGRSSRSSGTASARCSSRARSTTPSASGNSTAEKSSSNGRPTRIRSLMSTGTTTPPSRPPRWTSPFTVSPFTSSSSLLTHPVLPSPPSLQRLPRLARAPL